MTRRSKRELERALEDLQGDDVGDYDGPEEITIRHHRVGTDRDDSSLDEGEEELEASKRIWRDDAGEWHSETVEGSHSGRDGGGNRV